MDNVFKNESYDTLKSLYLDIIKRNDDGLRPLSLDPYIREVRNIYPFLDFGEAWKYTEKMFFYEVGERYFKMNLESEKK